jgi:nucleotide-binding universal stress UspA family protein
MSYKTILLHCNDHRRIAQLLLPTLALADRFQSHLIGLSVVPPVSVITTGAIEAPPIIVNEHCELYRQENAVMRRQFQEATAGRSFTAEWRDADAGPFGVADVVLDHGRAADLIVASQTDREWAASEWLDVADRVAVESGRPTLIIANASARDRIGSRVLIAWNGRREAARAAFDALPILKQAAATKVVWIDQESESDIEPERGQDICKALLRHGVKCGKTERVTPPAGVGEALMAQAQAFDADLLVMGCYGHSRLREFVFGGATRYALQKMGIPVLMSH